MKRSSTTVVALPNRFERRRERTRQELLAAATRVLAEKGLHETKVTDIAAAADVGVGTFYLHFPDKETLFDAVVEETVHRLKATVDAGDLLVDRARVRPDRDADRNHHHAGAARDHARRRRERSTPWLKPPSVRPPSWTTPSSACRPASTSATRGTTRRSARSCATSTRRRSATSGTRPTSSPGRPAWTPRLRSSPTSRSRSTTRTSGRR